MRILKKARLENGGEVTLEVDEMRTWKGFVVSGIEPHVKPQTLSAAVMIWNRVVQTADRVTVKGISAKIIGNKQIH